MPRPRRKKVQGAVEHLSQPKRVDVADEGATATDEITLEDCVAETENALCAAVGALVEGTTSGDDAEQLLLCTDFLESLREKTAPESGSAHSIRSTFGSNMRFSSRSDLPTTVGSLIRKGEGDDFAIDDEASNQPRQSHSTVKWVLGLRAARVYAEILTLQGAWHTGLVEISTLSSICALSRRWNSFCHRAATDSIGNGGRKSRPTVTFSVQGGKRRRGKSESKAEEAVVDDDDEENRSLKESTQRRKLRRRILTERNAAEEHEDDSESNRLLADEEVLLEGLCLGETYASIPSKGDFFFWSEECRELYVSCVISMLATAAALGTSQSSNQVASKAQQTKRLIQSALKMCFDCLEGGERIVQLHKRSPPTFLPEMVVFVGRSLLPPITCSIDLPFGQRGKIAAFKASEDTLEIIARSLSNHFQIECDKDGSQFTTPRPRPRTSSSSMMQHPQSSSVQKERLDVLDSENSKSLKMCPPSLKKGKSPRFRQSPGQRNSDETDKSQRDSQFLSPSGAAVAKFYGVVQKLTASESLRRAAARSRHKSTVIKCLRHLPFSFRHRFLGFVVDSLCQSQVYPQHRLFGVELVGTLLTTERWVWDSYEIDNPQQIAQTPNGRASRFARTSEGEDTKDSSRPQSLLFCIHERLIDVEPVVRARAAHTLSEVVVAIQGADDGIVSCLSPYPKVRGGKEATDDSEAPTSPRISKCFRHLMQLNGHFQAFVRRLRKRATSDKHATVRKASISAWVALLLMNNCLDGHALSEEDIAFLRSLCKDESSSTRRAAAEAITTMLQSSCGEGRSETTLMLLERAWTEAVLPLVQDSDSYCSSAAISLFSSVVVEPIAFPNEDADDESNGRMCDVAWRVVALVGETPVQAGVSRRYANSFCIAWQKMRDRGTANLLRSFAAEVIRAALSHDERHHEAGCHEGIQSCCDRNNCARWFALEVLLDSTPVPQGIIKSASRDWSAFMEWWKRLFELQTSPELVGESHNALLASTKSYLAVVSKMAPHMDLNVAKSLLSSMTSSLKDCLLPFDLAGNAILAVVHLQGRLASDEFGWRASCEDMLVDLFDAFEQVVEEVFSSRRMSTSSGFNNNKKIHRAIYSVGEVSLVGYSPDQEAASKSMGTTQGGKVDVVRSLRVLPSSRLIERLQLLLPPTLPPMTGEPVRIPATLRSLACVALGRISLRDERVARTNMPLLASHLGDSSNSMGISGGAEVKCSAIIVLGDLCMAFTNLADRYVPAMAECLQAETSPREEDSSFRLSMASQDELDINDNAGVRKNAIIVLADLINQDYIKWRGLLFHRFLAATVDEDTHVADLATATLCGPLLMKYPKMFASNLVEATFVLNGCTNHPVYSAATASGDSGAGQAVAFRDTKAFHGDKGRHRRLQAYDVLLRHLSDEDKLNVTARMTKEILEDAADRDDGILSEACTKGVDHAEAGKANESNELERAAAVISDCLVILASPLLNIGRGKMSEGDEESLGEITDNSKVGSESVNAKQAVAKATILGKISCKQLIQTVVPVLCRLKARLVRGRSHLIRDLMAYFAILLSNKNNKKDIREALANDPVLLQEVEFETRQFMNSNSLP